ncbi:MAG: TetR/AcrR family transcriptional regulator [Parasphingorhabdus sp.]|uniref:TetR/AcrR family transcriptional regulator n=1 Tax=Parasphingorhabdus sp. TaxID=2709688 RepID=UPI00300186F1
MLAEARRMIAEGGLENFSIRKLCQRADVAQRTFYNAYESKDRLIALAIREAYDDFQKFISYRTDPFSLEGVIDRTLSTNRRNFKVRNYTKAIVSIYFSSTTSNDIWKTIQDMTQTGWADWFKVLKEQGLFKEWAEPDRVANEMANLQYSIISDWCLGRLPDEEYLSALFTATLTILIGATKGEVADKAEEMLQTFHISCKLPEFPKPAGRVDGKEISD